MFFEENKKKQHNKYFFKKGDALQTLNFKKLIIFRRISPGSSFASGKGSMMIEMAVTLPFFLIASLTILSFVFMLEQYTQKEFELYELTKKEAVYVGAYSQLVEGRKNDIVKEQRIYRAKPLLQNPFLSGLQTENHCLAHAFTGYSVDYSSESSHDNRYVYVTKEGTAYHQKRSCSHLNITIEIVSGKKMSKYRNEDGAIYYGCHLCSKGFSKKDLEEMSVFLTPYGNRYHTNMKCSDLTRTIQIIPLSKAGGYSPCKDCVNDEL